MLNNRPSRSSPPGPGALANRALGITLAVLVGIVLVALPLSVEGAPIVPGSTLPVVASASSLTLDGDSSLHRYSAKAHDMEVGIGVDDARLASAEQPLGVEALILGHFVRTFQLLVPTKKLTSGEKSLDANMRKALKNEDIRFQMDSYDVLPSAKGGPALTVELHGRLTLAGVERKIDVGATGVRVADGLRISGSKDLLMTDYQIKPPTLMFGTIKTKDLITVKFTTTLQRGTK
jgi:hypothetical protein